MNDKALEIMRLCIELNGGTHTVWCDFSGHIDALNVHATEGKWKKGKKELIRCTVYLDWPGAAARLAALRDELLALSATAE